MFQLCNLEAEWVAIKIKVKGKRAQENQRRGRYRQNREWHVNTRRKGKVGAGRSELYCKDIWPHIVGSEG